MIERAELEQQLADLVASRPDLPRPVPSLESQEYQRWRKTYQAWVDRKSLIEGLLAGCGLAERDIVMPSPKGFVRTPVRRKGRMA